MDQSKAIGSKRFSDPFLDLSDQVVVRWIGNPEGDDKPNKKYYDPRKWLRPGEESIKARLLQAFEDLNCLNRN